MSGQEILRERIAELEACVEDLAADLAAECERAMCAAPNTSTCACALGKHAALIASCRKVGDVE